MQDLDPRETAHLKKRDSKFKKRYDMVVSQSGKALAQVIHNIRRKKK